MFFKLTAIRYSIEAKILVLVINIPYHKLKPIYRKFRLCITKAHRAKPIPLRLHEPKDSLREGAPDKVG